MNSERKQAHIWQIVETLPVSLIVYYGTIYYMVTTQLTNDHNDDKLFLRTPSLSKL